MAFPIVAISYKWDPMIKQNKTLWYENSKVREIYGSVPAQKQLMWTANFVEHWNLIKTGRCSEERSTYLWWESAVAFSTAHLQSVHKEAQAQTL